MEEEKQQTRISSKPFGTKKTNNLMIEKNEEREENSPIGTNTRNSLLKKTLSGTVSTWLHRNSTESPNTRQQPT